MWVPEVGCRTRIIGRLIRAGAGLAILAVSLSRAYAGADDYVFEAVQPEIKASNVATVAVRLVDKTSRKPVTDATIVDTRIEMAPGEGHQMRSAIALRVFVTRDGS